MTDEEIPFATYRQTLEAAVAARGRVLVKIVCKACRPRQHAVATVYDSPHGAVFYAEFPAPSQKWALAEAAAGAAYPTLTSTDLVEWGGDKPDRGVAARCRNHGPLAVNIADLGEHVTEFRQTFTVQRHGVDPSPA